MHHPDAYLHVRTTEITSMEHGVYRVDCVEWNVCGRGETLDAAKADLLAAKILHIEAEMKAGREPRVTKCKENDELLEVFQAGYDVGRVEGIESIATIQARKGGKRK